MLSTDDKSTQYWVLNFNFYYRILNEAWNAFKSVVSFITTSVLMKCDENLFIYNFV